MHTILHDTHIKTQRRMYKIVRLLDKMKSHVCIILYTFMYFIVIDPCVSQPCVNSGSCVLLSPNNFTCLCNNDYTGLSCENRKLEV